MILYTPPDGCLSLSETLDCGQAFRWKPVPDGRAAFCGTAFGHTLTVSQADNDFCFDCTKTEFEKIWFPYFDFSTDYARIRETVAALHPLLADAARFAPGIRILRQEPWEALCAFIISQNNNIARIKGIMARLCALFGTHNGADFTFPTPARLAACTAEDLAPLRAGFRAKYLIDAAKRVDIGGLDLESLRTLPLPQAREAMQTVLGVGPKVAECALLYGLHRTECFPLDVWMKRAMTHLPGVKIEDFGENAGFAQQYIFHYARMHPALFR